MSQLKQREVPLPYFLFIANLARMNMVGNKPNHAQITTHIENFLKLNKDKFAKFLYDNHRLPKHDRKYPKGSAEYNALVDKFINPKDEGSDAAYHTNFGEYYRTLNETSRSKYTVPGFTLTNNMFQHIVFDFINTNANDFDKFLPSNLVRTYEPKVHSPLKAVPIPRHNPTKHLPPLVTRTTPTVKTTPKAPLPIPQKEVNPTIETLQTIIGTQSVKSITIVFN